MLEFQHEEHLSPEQAAERLADIAFALTVGRTLDLPHPDDGAAALLDGIELVVPHQANKTMVTKLATDAGLAAESLYFNIARVGNLSAASIPVAIHDTVQERVIDRPMHIFTPSFGAGAVGGYAVLRVDPAIVVHERAEHADEVVGVAMPNATSSDDVRDAFGG